jgi:hypothetical protein
MNLVFISVADYVISEKKSVKIDPDGITLKVGITHSQAFGRVVTSGSCREEIHAPPL